MADGPIIARVAALIGDPARANILTALMDGRALTVTELAGVAGVTIQTASGHIAKLGEAQLIAYEKQGRHRYVRLSGSDVAQVLEALMGLAQRTGAVPVRAGPSDTALRNARVCYDHLAGELGVRLFDSMTMRKFIENNDRLSVTPEGQNFLSVFGIDINAFKTSKRPVCRTCLDWSERRFHLGGALGAALLSELLKRKWATRSDGRVVNFSPKGRVQFESFISGNAA
jgi:DNA-binding transcriptional ArsR family regulator